MIFHNSKQKEKPHRLKSLHLSNHPQPMSQLQSQLKQHKSYKCQSHENTLLKKKLTLMQKRFIMNETKMRSKLKANMRNRTEIKDTKEFSWCKSKKKLWLCTKLSRKSNQKNNLLIKNKAKKKNNKRQQKGKRLLLLAFSKKQGSYTRKRSLLQL